jgi:transcriptional regulator with PAS, ATPase and Fis domain/tetratricopeptide (TPR) repeat protein
MDIRTVDELKKQGRFINALNALDAVKPATANAVHIQRIEILERLGRHGDCRALLEFVTTRQLTSSQKGICEYVASHLDLEDGETKSAVAHLQRATSLARDAHDLELLCKAQMKLLVVIADISGPDAAAPILSELRRNTVNLADPHTSAAVHVFVAEMEARRGLFQSAQRHLAIAYRLIGDLANPWLEAIVENINLAACVLELNVDAGEVHAVRGIRLADESGAALVRRALAANYAALHFIRGNFHQAVESLDRALALLRGERRNACLETLARIRLAEGRLEDCAMVLNWIEESIKNDADRGQYANRYALLTRSHLLARQGFIQDALLHIDQLADITARMDDRFLGLAARLTKMELLQISNRGADTSSALTLSISDLQNLSPELYVQYERIVACGLMLQGDVEIARSHHLRAQRLCAALGCIPPRLELDRRWEDEVSRTPMAGTNSPFMRSAITSDVLHTVSALLTHTGRGEYVAREIAELMLSTQCVRSARGVAHAGGSAVTLFTIGESLAEKSEPIRERTLIIQDTAERRIELVIELMSSVAAQTTLNSVAHLLATLTELERARTDREERATIWPADDLPLDDQSVITGHMREIMTLAQKVARTTVSVLITGDSGTGKEIVARAIHNYSARAQKPFVPFNCAAVPRDLVESQLFGHRRGGFTGADRDYLGLIRAARDGTLFLDEIGELSPDLQPKFLRFLESGEISPLGETAHITVNVRIVAATNANLEDAVRDGKFREDLFYRLNVVRLSLKPLRERRDEIPGLVNHFVARAVQEFVKGHLEIAEETMERLLLYRWPGNVRQLQNELRRMVALAEPDSTLEPSSISDEILRAMPIFRTEPVSGKEIAVRLQDKLLPTLSRVECEMIKAALRDNHGKVDAVARALGISRKGLYLKRQRLGL